MARKSQAATETTEAPAKLTKEQLLSQLDDISEYAGQLARDYFGGRKSVRKLKKYHVTEGYELLPAKTPDNAKHVFEVLKAAEQGLTIEQWADALRPTFSGKSQNMQNVIRANKSLLVTIGAVEEIEE